MSQLDLARPGQVGDGSPEPDRVPDGQRTPNGLSLVTPIGESTWLGRDAHGRSVTARRLPDAADQADPAADPAPTASPGVIERAEAVTSLRAPSLVPVLGVQRWDGALWLVSESDDGVWLDRVLELTRPSPAQAVVIGLDAVCGLQTVHAAGYAHGSICAGVLRLGPDGRLRLDGWAAGALSGSAPLAHRQRADVGAVGVVLADLARAVRGSPHTAAGSTPALLAALDAAAGCAARPGADAGLVAAPLEAVCGPGEDATTRTELAALVATATASRSMAARCPSPAASAPAGSTGFPREARFGAALRGVWKRIWTWVVALAVLAAAVTLEYVLLHERITQNVHLLREGSQPGQGSAAPAGPAPEALQQVPEPAPASAGVVEGLDLRALQPCTPGAVCMVRVLVRLQPQPAQQHTPGAPPQPRTVAWSFQVVDRCTGSQRGAAGGVVSVPPGGDQVQAVSTVPLPTGRFLAVTAVTSQPASVAGTPLLVSAGQNSC